MLVVTLDDLESMALDWGDEPAVRYFMIQSRALARDPRKFTAFTTEDTKMLVMTYEDLKTVLENYVKDGDLGDLMADSIYAACTLYGRDPSKFKRPDPIIADDRTRKLPGCG